MYPYIDLPFELPIVGAVRLPVYGMLFAGGVLSAVNCAAAERIDPTFVPLQLELAAREGGEWRPAARYRSPSPPGSPLILPP